MLQTRFLKIRYHSLPLTKFSEQLEYATVFASKISS